jgi:hypothetical protein
MGDVLVADVHQLHVNAAGPAASSFQVDRDPAARQTRPRRKQSRKIYRSIDGPSTETRFVRRTVVQCLIER